MRKTIFLFAVLATCLAPLASCSKDDGRRDPSENLKSVAGTEWISTEGTLKFSKDRYALDCELPCYGNYSQSGNHIQFDGSKCIITGASLETIETGEISKYGDSMTVTFKKTSWTGATTTETVRFTYNILK